VNILVHSELTSNNEHLLVMSLLGRSVGEIIRSVSDYSLNLLVTIF